jgi:two-component system, sensor histidine kinase RegB
VCACDDRPQCGVLDTRLAAPSRRNYHRHGEPEPENRMRLIDRADTSPGEADAAAGGTARTWREVVGSTAARRRGDLVDPHRRGALNRRLLVLLVIARLTMVGTGIAALLLWGGPIGEFPLLRVSLVLLAVGGLNYFVQSILKRSAPPSEHAFLLQLLGDLALLSYAIHEIGGVDNPFLMFYLVPLTLAAYALSWRPMLVFASVTAACVLVYHRVHADAPPLDAGVHQAGELILMGIVTYFAFAVARLSRAHERAVARAREDALAALGAEARGTVAASAADMLGSPLATISVLIQELRQGRLPPVDSGAALGVLEQQVQACKDSLSALLASVGQVRGERGTRRGVDAMLFAVARECELLNPRVSILFEPIAPAPPQIAEDRSLFDAFALMFKHCARTSPHNVFVALRWDAEFVTVDLSGAQRPPRAAGAAAHSLRGHPDSGSLSLVASLLARFGATLAQLGDERESSLQVQLPMAALGATQTLEAAPRGAAEPVQ